MLTNGIEAISTPESSSISVVGYSQKNSTLYIKFKSGEQIYEWYNVPFDVWDGFKTTISSGESVGKYYHANIKGKYDSMTKSLNSVECGV